MQYPGGGILQAGGHYLQQHQHQQAQQMSPQSLMAARSSMLYGAQPYPSLQQQALHNQLGMSSGGSSGLMLQGEPHSGGGSSGLGFPDFVRGNAGDGLQRSKQDIGSNAAAEGRGGSDGGETLYLKSNEDGN